MGGHRLVPFGGKLRTAALAILAAAGAVPQAPAQGPKPEQAGLLADSLRDVEARVRELNSTLHEMEAEVTRSRAEAAELRQELKETREQVSSLKRELGEGRNQSLKPAAMSSSTPTPEAPASAQPSAQESLAKLEEDQQLINAKVDEQHQTKVESASKYPVRLSGIVLLNMFSNRGTVDNQDIPTLALPRGPLDSRGSFGATMRQSELGLEAFGPEIWGARTTADIQFDLAGGFPAVGNGVTSGIFRLRTATIRMDWSHTSVVAGQDALFFSPLTPTSFASLAVPAFSYSGNLWSWAPQVRVERCKELSSGSTVTLQAGILDPLTWESNAQFLRVPGAGERSRQPAYAARAAWSHGESERRYTVGVASYYSRQHYGFGRNVDGWAATSDWSLPFTPWFTLTGEFYRGRAVGGLGGALGRTVLFNGPLANPATSVHALNSLGGWSQLKFKPLSTLEFNVAYGQENPLARDVRFFNNPQGFGSLTAVRNRTSLANFIYRPRSDLLFSAEYRRLRTFDIRGTSRTADQVNLMMGVLF